jgi:hypothetical protein
MVDARVRTFLKIKTQIYVHLTLWPMIPPIEIQTLVWLTLGRNPVDISQGETAVSTDIFYGIT